MIGKKTLESKPIPAAKVKEILEEFSENSSRISFTLAAGIGSVSNVFFPIIVLTLVILSVLE